MEEIESNQSRRKFIQQTGMIGAGVLLAGPLQLFSQTNKSGKMSKNIKSKGCAGKDEHGTIKASEINDAWDKVVNKELNSNATVKAFKAMLPLTINMDELNGNEKFHYFSTTLPTNPTAGGNIQAGDLMLYANNYLVLFYEDFNTSYSYTRLGRIDNISGLVTALGFGSVTIKFENN